MEPSKCVPHSAKVVIVGAGIAGLAAAQHLIKKGFKDVVILEAKERVGGRISTREIGNKALDFGAQFVHGSKDNPVFEIASEHHLVEEDSSSDEDDDEKQFFYTPKGKMIDENIVNEACALLDEIFMEGDKFARKNVPLADIEDSIGTFAHREFYKYLRTSRDSNEIAKIKEGIFNWRLLKERTENACKSVYEMSLYAWGEYMECPGFQGLELKQGFQSVLDVIMEDIPNQSIKLNTAVSCIYWDTPKCGENTSGCPPYPVQVVTTRGQVISADHLIITSSVGFLKKNAHTMFKPLLPNNKLAVIHRMGFGTVDKVFLEYEQPWWDKHCDAIQFVWNNDEPFILNCVDNQKQAQYLRKDWYQSIQGFDTMNYHPNLLEGWIAGDEAEIMETLPEDVVLEICHELLQRFTGNPHIPKPIRIMRTSWHSDAYTWGAYSYIKVGHTAADCDILAKPLCQDQVPRVLFAGEATHKQYFSTTHGALLSGQREAERILQCSNQADIQK